MHTPLSHPWDIQFVNDVSSYILFAHIFIYVSSLPQLYNYIKNHKQYTKFMACDIRMSGGSMGDSSLNVVLMFRNSDFQFSNPQGYVQLIHHIYSCTCVSTLNLDFLLTVCVGVKSDCS